MKSKEGGVEQVPGYQSGSLYLACRDIGSRRKLRPRGVGPLHMLLRLSVDRAKESTHFSACSTCVLGGLTVFSCIFFLQQPCKVGTYPTGGGGGRDLPKAVVCICGQSRKNP